MRPENDNKPQSSPGVTNRTVRHAGGATVEERFWTDPVSGQLLSRATRTETSWDADGCEVVSVSASRNGGAWTTESETVRDCLGRTVATRSAGVGCVMLVTSNVYDSAGRAVMTRAADGSRTVYAYDALGNTAGAVRIGPAQALDFDPQDFTLAGVIAMDAYVLEETPAWKEESDLGLSAYGVPTAWWDCSASVSHLPGRGAVTTSVTRVQLTGLSTACTARTVTTGADGVSAITAEALDAANARKTATLRNTATAGHETSVTVAGRVTGGTNALGSAVAHLYDGFARRTSAEETAGSRTLRTLTGYHADGTVAFTAEAVGAATNATSYSVRQYLDSPAGAYLVTTADPLGNVTTNHYSGDGALYRSGGAVYPTATARDADGRQAELRTWRDEAGQPDATRWHYDLASGLVTNKVYADGLGPAYAYLPDGRLSQRTWARGVETAYGYADTAAGRVQSADHSDGTPSVTNAYDLAGRLTRVEDGAGARTFAYDALGRLAAETNALAVITRRYDAQGMPSEFIVDNDAAITYAYDDLIRLTNVSLGGLTFGCAYLPQTRMQVSASNSCGSGWGRSYEGGRNLIAAVTNFHGSSLVASYVYTNDALGRRVARNGDAIAYNTRSELTGATVGPTAYGYGYDGIGNLLFSAAGAATNTYAANALNQYASITGAESVSPAYDTDGNMLTNGVWAYAWDAGNRLSAVDADGVPLVSNAYDYLGRRLREIYFSAEDSYSDRDIKILREKDSIRCINYYGNVHEFWSDYDQGKFRPPNLIKKEDGPSF
ncbi:MAG TPA: hypothetical protein PLU38_03530 [Kiritimatiellia bacterium]|nr:MAG: tRNA3(Ser)-specific nuclease WapA precursor [Verrucomicrobia bacterium ADurb.Bin070]HPO37827.1 hypothetical protein [Kiritimatiellia bacterium]HQQ90916.1 hypothetical protein [Kiritimatiellia bacterium]